MTRIVTLPQIEALLPDLDVIEAMEQAFVDYSAGRAVVPPVGELLFDDPPGDAHIKYGYLKGDDIFVVKVACGFYDNPRKGLPGNTGLVLVFDQTNGLPRAVLLDEGMLTNVRTAAAGATAAKHLAAPNPGRIAVLGGGVQARMQVEMLARVTTCRDVSIWARRAEAAETLGADLARSGFRPTLAASPADAVADADIIVTATAATTPLISRQMLKPGAHVTAVGSDTHDKQELDVDLLAEAIVVADSKSQCRERGEIHHALAAGLINEANIVELGAVIAGLAQGRTHADQITVADLTGVAVQDIAMAKAVLARLGDA